MMSTTFGRPVPGLVGPVGWRSRIGRTSVHTARCAGGVAAIRLFFFRSLLWSEPGEHAPNVCEIAGREKPNF